MITFSHALAHILCASIPGHYVPIAGYKYVRYMDLGAGKTLWERPVTPVPAKMRIRFYNSRLIVGKLYIARVDQVDGDMARGLLTMFRKADGKSWTTGWVPGSINALAFDRRGSGFAFTRRRLGTDGTYRGFTVGTCATGERRVWHTVKFTNQQSEARDPVLDMWGDTSPTVLTEGDGRSWLMIDQRAGKWYRILPNQRLDLNNPMPLSFSRTGSYAMWPHDGGFEIRAGHTSSGRILLRSHEKGYFDFGVAPNESFTWAIPSGISIAEGGYNGNYFGIWTSPSKRFVFPPPTKGAQPWLSDDNTLITPWISTDGTQGFEVSTIGKQAATRNLVKPHLRPAEWTGKITTKY